MIYICNEQCKEDENFKRKEIKLFNNPKDDNKLCTKAKTNKQVTALLVICY